MLNGAMADELPTITSEKLIEKIRRIANGECLISGEVLESAPKPRWPVPFEVKLPASSPVHQSTSTVPLKERPQLTAEELAVLQLIMLGQSNPQIAEMLKIPASVIRRHLSHLFDKFDVRERTALVVAALRRQALSFADIDASVTSRQEKHRVAQKAS
ncbi:MAG TPA: LuxR C-terminal-related transcriptional regulator [Ktedonobacteraceae bacterium]|jgi:DNA-binding NarL/FixJ family response regulator|nr:LuxR C-terminal-related transcriptional regulator [Ktedonobacteraceae bacterium]